VTLTTRFAGLEVSEMESRLYEFCLESLAYTDVPD